MLGGVFITTILKRIYNIVVQNVGLISGILSIGLFISENFVFKLILCIFIVICVLSTVVYILLMISKTDKAKEKIYNSYCARQFMIAEKLHSYNHNLRNYTSSIYSKNNISRKDVIDTSINICNYISEFYRKLFGDYLGEYDICVCIKLIKPNNIYDDNYDSWEMETIARNVSSKEQRKKIDGNNINVKENTDFQVIISESYEDEWFAFADMSNIKQDFLNTYKIEYKNSRDDYIKYYKSTIVVPIKVDGFNVSDTLKKRYKNIEKKNLILGFLCIDSLKTFNNKEEIDIFTIGIEYAKSIADSLYIFFEKILISNLDCNNINTIDKQEQDIGKDCKNRRIKNGNYKKNNNKDF